MKSEKNVRRVSVWWLVATSGLAIAAIIMAIAMVRYRSDAQHLEKELWEYQIKESQAEEKEKRAEEKRQLQKNQNEARDKRGAEAWPRSPRQPNVLTPDELAAFKAKGLEDPYKDIISDLLEQNDIIPLEPDHGLTFRFWPSEETYVLGPNRVAAYFEDGHFGGNAILQYEVSDSGEIKWQWLSPLKKR